MKKLFSTRRNKVTKKFWKFVNEDGCSPGDFDKIEYIPGETIEVEDADPRKNIQCSSGIHCLDFSDEKYNSCNIVFGPKVAILEVDEKDIIYYKKGGKCRVKKAKVLEVKEPELWMKTGNGNSLWALNCAAYCGHHPDVMQTIIDSQNPEQAYSYAALNGHNEKLMQIILDSKNVRFAYLYARYALAGHNEKIMQLIIDGSKSTSYAYLYAKHVLQGHDEKLMQVILDAQDAFYAYDYANDIIEGHDESLMQIIIDQKNPCYAYLYARDVLKGHDEKLMKIVQKDFSFKNLYEKIIPNKE